MAGVPAQKTLSPLAWALLALLALIWGASFLSNRATLAEVPVLTAVAFRVNVAAAALWAWVLLRRLPLPGLRAAPAFLGMGVLNNVIPFGLIVWGQQFIPSGLAAIFNATTAIFGVLLAALFFADERLTLRKAAGVAIGFTGVAIAIGPESLAALDPTSLGQLAVLGATFSYACAGIFARSFLHGLRPEVAAAGMLTGAALVMLPAALWFDGAPRLDYAPATWAALLYLALVASAAAYVLYYAVLARAGAGNLGLVTLMVVPVAIALGALVYRERLLAQEYAGFLVIALGLMVLDARPRALFGRPAPPAPPAT
ncbi:MAG: DMT family transporter, partial [Rhodobacteraceae bacterium]|nr:DMT family transporter [Paracoccaceae bacterium]